MLADTRDDLRPVLSGCIDADIGLQHVTHLESLALLRRGIDSAFCKKVLRHRCERVERLHQGRFLRLPDKNVISLADEFRLSHLQAKLLRQTNCLAVSGFEDLRSCHTVSRLPCYRV